MTSTLPQGQDATLLPSDYAQVAGYQHSGGLSIPSDTQNTTENAPLLRAPPIPVVDEEIDGDPDHDSDSKSALFWEEAPILTKYALPVFGTHLLEHTLALVPVISIGHLSTKALAAVTLGSMTATVSGFSIISGFCSALDTTLPSAWTSEHPKYVGLWAQRMSVLMVAVLVPIFLIWFNAESILLSLKQDPEVAHLAAIYLRWISIGLPAYTFNVIGRRYFQSQGLFNIPTRIIFIVAPINAFLGWLLVWSPIGLGFVGAPLASAISFNLIALLNLTYGLFFVDRRAWHPWSLRAFSNLGYLFRLGASGVAQSASEWWAWELVTLAVSQFGPAALAAQSALVMSASTTCQAASALGVATSVRIGNLLGEGKVRRAHSTSDTSIVLALIVSVLNCALYLVFRKNWGRLFNDDEEVVSLVADIVPLIALFQLFDGNANVTSGVLRACGMQHVGAVLGLTAYYVIGIPIGVVLAFRWHMGLQGLWIGLTIALIYMSSLGTYYRWKINWYIEMEKVKLRLEKEERLRKADLDRIPIDEERGIEEEEEDSQVGYGAVGSR
ncbi:multidrug Oligosaccharidyl-lipid polysaccharide flippase [Ephemerocybe angulata]|uniref:Multidrug Oligosaccharidyl-lipid polysaccharide flippase n=1 Tax=Ephemerocybe angulata TaxID=980116 RepID=A0A8H6M9E6_9AGAR|nr:multidrug Oligosaccharidyl-lipid polysaccharide flippase [Tulosesus angulatus]